MLLPLAFYAALVSARDCTAKNAFYYLRDAPYVTAVVLPRAPRAGFPGNVKLEIKSSKTGQTFGFWPFVAGSGVGVKSHLLRLTETGEPDIGRDDTLNDQNALDYIVSDEDYRFQPAYLIALESQAPQHILIPNLQQVFWYDDWKKREYIPLSFFDLKCGVSH